MTRRASSRICAFSRLSRRLSAVSASTRSWDEAAVAELFSIFIGENMAPSPRATAAATPGDSLEISFISFLAE